MRDVFCPNCKSLMFPGEDGVVCKECGYSKDKADAEEKIVMTSTDKEVAVIEDSIATLPKTKVECPKCGNNEAFFVLRQTRAADEPETRIYRCTKCEHSWREY